MRFTGDAEGSVPSRAARGRVSSVRSGFRPGLHARGSRLTRLARLACADRPHYTVGHVACPLMGGRLPRRRARHDQSLLSRRARVAGVGVFLRSLAAITYRDVLFVAAAWAVARGRWRSSAAGATCARCVYAGFVGVAAFLCLYAVASVVAFGVLGGFLTYSLLQLVGNLRMLSSSVTMYLTPGVVTGLVCVPLGYVVSRLGARAVGAGGTRAALAAAGAGVRRARRVGERRSVRVRDRLGHALRLADRRESAVGLRLVVVAGDERRADGAPGRQVRRQRISPISSRSDDFRPPPCPPCSARPCRGADVPW